MIIFYLVVINVNNKRDLKKIKNHWYKIHDKIKVYCKQCEYKTTFKMLLNNSYLVNYGIIQYLCYKCKYREGGISSVSLKTRDIHNPPPTYIVEVLIWY